MNFGSSKEQALMANKIQMLFFIIIITPNRHATSKQAVRPILSLETEEASGFQNSSQRGYQ